MMSLDRYIKLHYSHSFFYVLRIDRSIDNVTVEVTLALPDAMHRFQIEIAIEIGMRSPNYRLHRAVPPGPETIHFNSGAVHVPAHENANDRT
ncbi:MAG: hypothetical protein GX811_07265 [Lentisphaerae bacterium]|nr:hypothetical protein [Lentisphaerota bacterium]